MKNYINNWLKGIGLVLAGGMMLASCNKELPQATPIAPPTPVGKSIGELINEDASFTFLKAAVTRAGLSNALADKSAVYTMFGPDDDAFRALFTILGLPANVSSINFFRPGQLDTLLKYHLIGGQEYKAAGILDKFPNMYMQSMFLLQAPNTAVPTGLRMPLHISKRGVFAWANNIPVKQADLDAANGVLHKMSFVLVPPTRVLADSIARDTSLSFLMAAVQRGDVAPPTGAPKLLPLLSNPAANFTIFAPNNNAFRALLVAYGLPPNISSINLLPSNIVWGIVAFHVLGERAFAANLAPGNSNLVSLIGVPIQAKVAVTPPMPPTSVEVRGPANNIPTTPPTPYYARVIGADRNCVNGVMHVIDNVMLPQ